jgi:putative transposase
MDALALVKSKDLIVYEDLKIQNMVKNHHLAKSISDASWYQFTQWLQYFAKIHGTIVIAVPPHNTTVDCSSCGAKVHKALSTRTHQCSVCKTVLDRDHNAARNILAKGLKLLAQYLNSTRGHLETGENILNAQGQFDRWIADRDIEFLSHLEELRISNCVENPPEP